MRKTVIRMIFVAIWILLGWFWFVHEVSLHFGISLFAAYMWSIPLMLCSSVRCFVEAERMRGNQVRGWKGIWNVVKRQLNAPITLKRS